MNRALLARSLQRSSECSRNIPWTRPITSPDDNSRTSGASVGGTVDLREHATPTESAIASISSGRSFFILEVRLYENNGQ